MFNTEYFVIYIMYLHAKIRIKISSDLLIITMKTEDKYIYIKPLIFALQFPTSKKT
jgi:hypothetical protein